MLGAARLAAAHAAHAVGRPRHGRAREIRDCRAEDRRGEWVDTLRAHVNKRIFYYYLHLTKAHLKEIIIATGHPFNGDDSVNEKGNQLSKRQKTTIFQGGSDAAGKRIQSYVRRRAIKGATATRRRARRSPSATASARTSARTRTAWHSRRSGCSSSASPSTPSG